MGPGIRCLLKSFGRASGFDPGPMMVPKQGNQALRLAADVFCLFTRIPGKGGIGKLGR